MTIETVSQNDVKATPITTLMKDKYSNKKIGKFPVKKKEVENNHNPTPLHLLDPQLERKNQLPHRLLNQTA
jgi:hypothetical protein